MNTNRTNEGKHAMQENTAAMNAEEWTTIVNTDEPGHSVREPKKALLSKKSSFLPEGPEESGVEQGLTSKLLPARVRKSKRERTHSKRVKFVIPNNEEIFFCKNDAPNTRRVLQVKSQVKQPQMFQLLRPEQELINAFRNKSCGDVICILEDPEFQTAQSIGEFDLEAVLQKEYTLIGNELKTINESENHSATASQMDDLSAKYKILNIYINCIHLIEKTMALKKWYALTIQLKYIDLQQNHSIVDAIGGNAAVKLDDGNVKEKIVSFVLALICCI
jgi:hypothetical protein